MPKNRAKNIGKVYFLKMLLGVFCFCVVSCSIVQAHPMPNTDIAIRLNESQIALEIKIPAPEFVLGFPKSEAVTGENLLSESREKVEAYFKRHLKILSESGVAQDYNIASLTVDTNADEFVGVYQELIAKFEVPVRGSFNPRDFLLAYDGVIHQVPNHFAVVRVTQNFNNEIFSETNAVTAGVIYYDFSSNTISPLEVISLKVGFWANFERLMVRGRRYIFGEHYCLLIFLTLLVIALLAIKKRAWTLFQDI